MIALFRFASLEEMQKIDDEDWGADEQRYIYAVFQALT